MKIRSGFVSNSSSSSFVVGFEKIPQTVEELMKMMFGENQKYVSSWGDDEDDVALHVHEVAERVFEDMKTARIISSLENLSNEIGSGYFEGFPELNWNQTPYRKFEKDFFDKTGKDVRNDPIASKEFHRLLDEVHREWEEAIDKAALELAQSEWPKFKDKTCYQFNYGDENGMFECVMEHGNIFKNLPHLQISHH